MEPQTSLSDLLRAGVELELTLRIKPRKRLKRDKPDALAVPESPDKTWSMDFASRSLGSSPTGWGTVVLFGC